LIILSIIFLTTWKRQRTLIKRVVYCAPVLEHGCQNLLAGDFSVQVFYGLLGTYQH